jgi:hypothetical protein
MNKIINYHVPDLTNIGDLLSSPLKYFDFPGFTCEIKDIRSSKSSDIEEGHIIIGGGGLLFSRFLPQIEHLLNNGKGKKVFWGVGQQKYGRRKSRPEIVDYSRFFKGASLIGIRDYGMAYPWVPCASCMHPEFDKPRNIKHEFVILSHKKFQISFPGIPRMTNKSKNFEEVLDFLGSGETILTSSFHAAYWGLLLNRKVLAFPFNSKFYTMKHPPTIYPAEGWSRTRCELTLFGRSICRMNYPGDVHKCRIENWKDYAKKAVISPDSLEECREQNRLFYRQVLETISH